MSFLFRRVISSPKFLLLQLMSVYIVASHLCVEAADGNRANTITVGAILDESSYTGKQEKRAIDIASQVFNNNSKTHKLIVHFHDSGGKPLQAASAAQELLRDQSMKVIVGMANWQEASLVAEAGSNVQVPVISFATSVAPSNVQNYWPHLIQMGSNQTAQMECIAHIVHAYSWRKVVAIYEDNPYNGDSGTVSLLADALLKAGTEIEYRLALPSYDSLSDTKEVVREHMLKLLRIKSRVFVVLKSSLPMVSHIFEEAGKIGLVGRESVWIIDDSITSTLDSANNSIFANMEGALVIKSYYSTKSNNFMSFLRSFRNNSAEKVYSNPELLALRAYDSITVISRAIERMSNNDSSSKVLLREMLLSNFSGLSGDVKFKDNMLSNAPLFKIMNIAGKAQRELDYWMPGYGFSKSLSVGKHNMSSGGNDKDTNRLTGSVIWPGSLKSCDPRGWAIPTETEPLRVGIPIKPSFENFVEEVAPHKYEGFCIDIFNGAQAFLSDRYSGLPYKFYPISASGTEQLDYDDMLNYVINKTYDMIAGDITILANRSEHVEFTQPYTESGLSLILPAESEGSAWLFMKPFSWQMWIATVSILLYTTFVIWFLEHRANPEFGGPRKSQLSTALWFSFSSLFFAQKEKIDSNFARIVVAVWLFLVFVLTSSYTASLSSMLTVQRMKAPRDVEWLKQNNLSVGYDERSDFVRTYIEEEFLLNTEKIVRLEGEDDYQESLQSKRISALFLELPYEKAFLAKYCTEYTKTTFAFRFGGLGFAFQKGSPLARDFSEAILTLAESGELKRMQDKWFAPTKKCSSDSDSSNQESPESLTLQNFWGLYGICGATSALCLVLSLCKNYRHREETVQDNVNGATADRNMWKKAIRITKSLGNGNFSVLERAPTLRKWQSSSWERLHTSDLQHHHRHPHSNEIQII